MVFSKACERSHYFHHNSSERSHVNDYNCWKSREHVFTSFYPAINFIQNHPLPLGQSLFTRTLPSGQNRESKPHPRDMKLENFTNVSIDSNTIWNEKLCGLNNETVFHWRYWLLKYYYYLAITRVKLWMYTQFYRIKGGGGSGSPHR